MMTYLKHTGRYKHSQLNKKTLEEIQVLYIKEQERIADFVPIGSKKDERLIQKMNKKVAGEHEEKVLEEPDSTKVEVKQEGTKESTRKRPGRRLKMKATKKIFRSDESSRWIKTFSEMVTMFDTLDLEELYNLGTYFELEDGTEIHMLSERKYPLTKETLERMMSLKLIAESVSESAYNLLSKELGSPKQMAIGKDILNPLIVDSLLKTIWLSMHHVIAMKHWLFPSKRLLARKIYSDWDQHQMSEEDEEKTTFYTDQGTYCYTKMPFGLKMSVPHTKDWLIQPSGHNWAETSRQKGKLLGYMVTSEGIRGNPKKTKAVADMQSLKTLKEMQSLSGKLAALNRFLSRICVSRNEEADTQTPNAHHSGTEKSVIRLPGHISGCNKPIKQILNKPEVSGKLAKYAVVLGAYNITYVPRNAIKGQVIVDFINEIPVDTKHMEICSLTDEEAKIEERTLYTDGASSLKGVGAGLVLIDPFGVEYTYAIRLNFPSTNKEAEYKALLAGLRIFDASSEGMTKYLTKEKEHVALFKKFSIQNIPRNQNQKADVLSKLASIAFNNLMKEVLLEVLNGKLVDAQEINVIVEEEEEYWMNPIIKCLEEGIWPLDENKARTLQMKISQYVMKEGVMFKKSYLSLMLRCVRPLQANYIIREIHALVPRLPKTRLTSIMSSWPFYQWGLDILRPLPEGPGRLKFIIIAIDYFTKFGLPRLIVTDNGTQLVNDPFKSWCERLGRERVGWVDKLPNILWAHQTMLKTSNGETPFSLTYESEAVIPAEIGILTYQTIQFNEAQNEEEMQLNLDLIQEMRETAAIREAKYKKKVEQYYNK
ncbi:reverse transcriptase domain-containing protein [Tanacetum coccineum]|uniref:Reverse transcriptase domain-containing protein n=1 Tax=Tanacetum coccineum TaxID=301880 RepID=A0ABQ5GZG5_9ASTR